VLALRVQPRAYSYGDCAPVNGGWELGLGIGGWVLGVGYWEWVLRMGLGIGLGFCQGSVVGVRIGNWLLSQSPNPNPKPYSNPQSPFPLTFQSFDRDWLGLSRLPVQYLAAH
jgi:hypothetical protein